MTRYARQMQVPGIGVDGQARLAAAQVLIVGAGGLGCTVIPALAAAGVGQLTVIDPDVVELTNLSGTFLFNEIDGLLEVAHLLRMIGLEVSAGAVIYFPADGRRPQTLE